MVVISGWCEGGLQCGVVVVWFNRAEVMQMVRMMVPEKVAMGGSLLVLDFW